MDLGVIRNVQIPTAWCTAMVVVAKSRVVPEEGHYMQKQKVRIVLTQREHKKKETRSALSQPDTKETGRGKSINEARRQFRVLANTSLAQF